MALLKFLLNISFTNLRRDGVLTPEEMNWSGLDGPEDPWMQTHQLCPIHIQ